MPRRVQVECEPAALHSDIDRNALARMLDRAAAIIERDESLVFGEIAVLVVGVERISLLHQEYFADPSPTDIITFPRYDEAGANEVSGDIAICLDVIQEQASEAGHSTGEELAFVGVHGLLHLAGWLDSTGAMRAAMLERQREILQEARGE